VPALRSTVTARRTLAILPLVALTGFHASEAAADGGRPIERALISMGEPEGFSNIGSQQRVVVDIFFAGDRIGETLISYRPGHVTFSKPGDVVAMLSSVKDRTAVQSALAIDNLPSNSALVCTMTTNPDVCGTLRPETAAIIFDEDRYRIDLFVNPELLSIVPPAEREFLNPPEGGLSMLSALNAVTTGSANGDRHHNIQNHLIIGNGNKRLRGDLGYATGFGIQADTLTFEIDKPGFRYLAGAFWAPGTDTIGRRKMLGFGFTTQIDTRFDRDSVKGIPLIVFLDQRSRVDILRNGRLTATRIYEAGNQALDTSGLPDGSYEVLLRITDLSGNVRQERRFFSKLRAIPTQGHPTIFAYAGVLANDFERGLLSPTSTPFMQAGAAMRMGKQFAVDGTIMTSNDIALSQIGINYISKPLLLRLAAIGSTDDVYGGLIQASSQNNGRLNFGIDARYLHIEESLPFRESSYSLQGPETLLGSDPTPIGSAQSSYTQITGTLSYSFKSLQVSMTGSFRKQRGLDRNYSIGPSARWEVLNRGRLRLALVGDLAVSDAGRGGFAGLNLRLIGRQTSAGTRIGMRHTRYDGETGKSGATSIIDAAWSNDNAAGMALGIGSTYEHDLGRDQFATTASMESKRFAATADIAKNLRGAGSPLQYGLGVHTVIVARGADMALGGKDNGESALMLKINGGDGHDQFNVLVDEQVVTTVGSGERLTVPLPSYREYDVRIQPVSDTLYAYDGGSKHVSLFPGNVKRLEWNVRPLVAIFGRLIFENGQAIQNAVLTVDGAIGSSDQSGFFQIEAPSGAQIEATLIDDRSCFIALPALSISKTFENLGNLVCRPRSTFASIK